MGGFAVHTRNLGVRRFLCLLMFRNRELLWAQEFLSLFKISLARKYPVTS